MKPTRPLALRAWLKLAAALLGLNALLTFHNVWPTLWVKPALELSIDLGVLLLALAAWAAFVGAVGRKALVGSTLLVLVLLLGRYAEVTAPALYGRPINLYWDSQHLPKVAAMLAAVGPWWLVGALTLGIVALLAGLIALIAWCLATVSGSLKTAAGRRAVGGLACMLVGVYALSQMFEWPARYRYSFPVAWTFLQQAQFVYAAATADGERDLPR
jgi:hypothetical protein